MNLNSRDADFSERPFVAGSLIGTRSFAVGPAGHLTGIVNKYPYTAGENLAQCIRADRVVNRLLIALGGRIGEQAAAEEAGHELLTLDCSCGFYAYFTGADPYNGRGDLGVFGAGPRVTGLIEGYGRTVVGSKGFRAEKTRVVALVFELEVDEKRRDAHPLTRMMFGLRPVPHPSPAQWAAIQHHYPEVPLYPSLADAIACHPLTVPDPEVV